MKAYRFDSFDSLDELRVREEPDPRPQPSHLESGTHLGKIVIRCAR